MKVKAAIVTEANGPFRTEEIEIDEPHAGEVKVKMSYAGMCYSDETLRKGGLTSDPELLKLISGRESMFPVIAGHEGAGVVESVGEGVTSMAPGDHVAVSFVPSCNKCDYCLSGRPYLCDLMATILVGPMISDQTWRHHLGETPLNRMCQIGAFSEYVVVNEASLIKIEPWYDLRAAALISCGIATGYGSAVNRGQVKHGDTVAVIGSGVRAVIAIDTNESKIERAKKIGATHGATSALEAAFNILPELTWGKNCDVVIITVNTLTGSLVEEARSITAKGGTVVLTSLGAASLNTIELNAAMFAMYNQDLRGTVFGSGAPRLQIPKLLRLHHEGKFPVDELVSKEYSIDEVEQGYQDLRDGKNVRGVVRF